MPGPARHLRHGRGHDQRAGVGLLPAGARTWHLPPRPPGRCRRGPGHTVAVGRPGTPQDRPGASVTDSVTDTGEDDTRLHRLLGGEPTAWLVQRARDRLEAARPLTRTVTLTGATLEQRRAVERLTGRPPRSGPSLSVSLPEVDRVLRESGAAPGGLAEAVALLTGPLRDRNRDRMDTASAWAAAFALLDEAVAGHAELVAWRGWLDATGIVRRLVPSADVALALLD